MALSQEDKLKRIQDRVRKLFNVANGSPYEEEARLAQRYGAEQQEFVANHEDTVGDSLVLYMKDKGAPEQVCR